MPYPAIVYKILIASPSDTEDERSRIRDLIHYWNDHNSEERTVAYVPIMWETHSTPTQGGRAQAVLNLQIVYPSDILIGIFNFRIGSPTGDFTSGSVEEIETFRKKKDPNLMLLYFNSQEPPADIDIAQWDALQEFRSKCMGNGPVADFSSVDDLIKQIERHLTDLARNLTPKERTAQYSAPVNISKEDVRTAFYSVKGMQVEKIDPLLERVHGILQHHGILSRDKLKSLTTSKGIVEFITNVYITELKRPAEKPLDPIALAQWGSMLLISNSAEEVKSQILLAVRRSNEFQGINLQEDWQGVEWEGRFFAWKGKTLHSHEDRDPVQATDGLLDVIRKFGYIASFCNKDNLGRALGNDGRCQVYETDRRTWRRQVLRGVQFLLVRPR